MKKVALLGDSIRLFGYGRLVPALLADKAEVYQPEENCKFAKNMLRMLFYKKEELKDCDVIHFNCGLWDVANIVGDGALFSTDEEYVANVLRIAAALKRITPHVIFATTTPVTAVMQPAAYSPNELMVLMSACKPAPPQLSLPATLSAFLMSFMRCSFFASS